MHGRWRIASRLLAVGVMGLLLSGCIKLNMDLKINSNDTVSGTMIFAFDKQLLAATGQSAGDVLGSGGPIPSSAPGVTMKPYADDKFTGQEFTFDSVPLSQFNTGQADSFNIVREGDVFKVSGVLDLSTDATGGSTPMDPALQQAMSTADIRVTITFPGDVVEANGEVSGNSVTWKPKMGERLDMQATGKATGGGSLGVILLIAAAVVVVALIVVVLSARKRRGAPGAPAVTELMASEPPAPGPMPSEPPAPGPMPSEPPAPEPPAPEPGSTPPGPAPA